MSSVQEGATGSGDSRGGVNKRGHTRSASHSGSTWGSHSEALVQNTPVGGGPSQNISSNDGAFGGAYVDVPNPQNPALTSILANSSSRNSSSLPGHTQRSHQRTFSHGQSVHGMTGPHYRGHRRTGSKTDFILPDGHAQREQERAKPPVGRTSSFPIGHRRNTSKTESIYTIRETKIPILHRILFWKKVCCLVGT